MQEVLYIIKAMSGLHELYMRRCLELAQLGQGKTHPNPMVGCVVLDKDQKVVGEGYHAKYGGPHAEVAALENAGERARGGTLYVNLEPCSHTGKTPPCTDRVLSAGIKTVVYGMQDPNPKVAGGGIQRLKDNGVTVMGGILETECRKLNEAFCHFIQARTPFVMLKLAMTLDGRIATRSGQSQWITSPLARRWVHQLRAESSAILTTAETVIQDNCQLTVREAPLLGDPPIRVILDRKLRLDLNQHHILRPDATGGSIWLFTQTGNLNKPQADQLRQAGVYLFEASDDGQGLVLSDVFATLGQAGVTQLLVEAGGRLAGSLLHQRQINKLWLLYGNTILSDNAAKPGFFGPPQFSLADASRIKIASSFVLDNTLVVEAYPM